jgi:predicted nuclease of predicted toxin-antitoxin system
MRLLIDECLPRALKRLLADHECRTVQEMGWSGKQNGVLLSLAEKAFDVLVTVDQGMEHEQNLVNRKIALLVLGARSNQIEDLTPIIPTVLAELRGISRGK